MPPSAAQYSPACTWPGRLSVCATWRGRSLGRLLQRERSGGDCAGRLIGGHDHARGGGLAVDDDLSHLVSLLHECEPGAPDGLDRMVFLAPRTPDFETLFLPVCLASQPRSAKAGPAGARYMLVRPRRRIPRCMLI